jgi:hypothetical protein
VGDGVSDLFDLFDPMAYMRFIESVKQPTGRTVPRPTAGLKLVTKPYAKFATKRSRSWPDSDLIMLDAAIADQLGAFLRHPVAGEVDRAGMGPDDLIVIRLGRASVDYQLVPRGVK